MATPDPKKWLKSDSIIRELFSDAAVSELTDRVKTLTVSDLMRLAYFSRPGDPPANDDTQLRNISLEDMKSLAKAMEVTMREKGIDDGWKYTGGVYACTPCMCTCAATLPPGNDR